MPLNRNRPYGIISGTGVFPSYEQADADGKTLRYYDSEGLEVDFKTGERLEKPVEVEADVQMKEGDWADAARELLRKADSMQFMQFAIKAAALLGGDNPPSNKKDIVAALQSRLDAMAGPAKPAAKKAAKVAEDDGAVDLAAWARGEKKALFDDVAKAIRESYARDVSTVPDALDLLIEEGVVSDDEAMKV
jgi:hypothetical protein